MKSDFIQLNQTPHGVPLYVRKSEIESILVRTGSCHVKMKSGVAWEVLDKVEDVLSEKKPVNRSSASK